MLRFNQVRLPGYQATRLPGYQATCLLAIFSFSLTACAQQDLNNFDKKATVFHDSGLLGLIQDADSGTPAAQLKTAPNAAVATLAQPAATQSKPIKMVGPTDPKVSAALDDAMPMLKKAVATHHCIHSSAGLRSLNYLAPPGRVLNNLRSASWPGQFMDNGYGFPLWKYHDASKCPSVQLIDNFSMPALNAFQFRVVYFAEDSGESDTFAYELRKNDEGEWQLWNFWRP